jgi:hypothetical protein
MRSRIAVLAVLVAAGIPAEVSGQVVSMRNLSFGTILSGTTSSVNKTSANSAQWRFTGLFALGGNFVLTLPTTMSGPGTAIALTFSTTDGQRSTTNNPATGTSFNPHVSQSVSVLFNGTVYVWLGASVSPPINQKAGTYTATVVLTTTGML